MQTPQFISRIIHQAKTIARKAANWTQQNCQIGPSTRKGIIRTLFATVIVSMGYSGYQQLRTGWGASVDVLLGVAIGILALALGYGLFRLALYLLSKLPGKFSAFVSAAFITLLFFLWGNPDTGFLLIGSIVLSAATLGGSITIATSLNFRNSSVWKKLWTGSLIALSSTAFVALFWWLGQTGSNKEIVRIEIPENNNVPPLTAADPSQPGAYPVEFLTYGNGTDRRPEFGEEASLKTNSVNGKPFTGELEGDFKSMRKNYWNFNCTELPLNGRVWYPKGNGPFPLVLIVHGNHSMREYSDPGYAYLGELLASRGYIFVSVDENFLNGDWAANYSKENDARGWLLLEHLKTWRKWNDDSENPFFNKVNMDKISLIGHSRGGEAVSIAAAFNKLKYYPDDARVAFDFDFNIRSVIAIAPIDGQYKPSNQSTPLENINYLLLQGSHDADVSFFSGDRQYKRIQFSNGKEYFKTSIYIYRANHGQFNTVWGNRDYGLPGGYFLNTKALLNGEDQRQIAKVYISSFLDATLKDNHQYLSLFRDYRKGLKWLPESYYINRYEDSHTRYFCDFDEDIDVTTTTVKGGHLAGKALANWMERDLKFRKGSSLRQNKAVLLGWEYHAQDSTSTASDTLPKNERVNLHQTNPVEPAQAFEAASYSITLPNEVKTAWNLDSTSSLTFAIAQLDQSPAKPLDLDKKEENEKNKEEENKEDPTPNTNKKEDKKKEEKTDKEEKSIKPLDFSIELEDEQGETVRMSIQEVGILMPPLRAKFTRFQPLEDNYGKSSEPILQTMEIQLAQLQTRNSEFIPTKLKEIRFLFDKSSKGVILLDEVGFRIRK
ncbi:MAG: hypothetical protein ACEPOZ_10345 [Marinifilaceae bacterium]